jgi:hypothetical protein
MKQYTINAQYIIIIDRPKKTLMEELQKPRGTALNESTQITVDGSRDSRTDFPAAEAAQN